MTDLKPLSPASGLLPLTIGSVTLSEPDMAPLTLVAPYKGKTIESVGGLAWPEVGRSSQDGDAQLIWFGASQALLIGAEVPPKLAAQAALTDQSDAWSRVMLEGEAARAVLARVTPIDMRDAVFPVGATARTELFHMQASITRTGDHSWQIMGFRSMAGTLVHDLKVAMEGVAARAL